MCEWVNEDTDCSGKSLDYPGWIDMFYIGSLYYYYYYYEIAK